MNNINDKEIVITGIAEGFRQAIMCMFSVSLFPTAEIKRILRMGIAEGTQKYLESIDFHSGFKEERGAMDQSKTQTWKNIEEAEKVVEKAKTPP